MITTLIALNRRCILALRIVCTPSYSPRHAALSRAGSSPLPYPVRLGSSPVAIATIARIITTKMAAANISTRFGMARSPRWLAPCPKYAPRCNAILHQSRVLGAWAEPGRRADPEAAGSTLVTHGDQWAGAATPLPPPATPA